MVPDRQRLSIDERANLVAYLDGELNDAEARSLATKLTQSMTARREVEQLRKTWELLDLLDRPRASGDFTARTLQSVAIGPAARAAIPERAGRYLVAALHGGVWVAALAVGFGLGQVFAARLLPDPSGRLARDLPIAESLDEYRDVGDFPFLKRLDQSGEFD